MNCAFLQAMETYGYINLTFIDACRGFYNDKYENPAENLTPNQFQLSNDQRIFTTLIRGKSV